MNSFKEISKTLKKTGIRFRKTAGTAGHRLEDVRKLVKRAHAVLVSPSRREEVYSIAGKKNTMIEFVYTPDKASINNLKVVAKFMKTRQLQKGSRHGL